MSTVSSGVTARSNKTKSHEDDHDAREIGASPPKPSRRPSSGWFGVFPVVTAMLALAEPWLDRLPLVARTFALTGVVVPAMVFVVMPALTRAFRSWLQR
jgi:antibiotic biosynthesis monooxygenase (ABM) superfamily enzyme